MFVCYFTLQVCLIIQLLVLTILFQLLVNLVEVSNQLSAPPVLINLTAQLYYSKSGSK